MTWDTVNVLAVPQAREIAGTLAGKIPNVLGMDQVGISQVLCPFPCDVLAMHRPGKLALVPSVWDCAGWELTYLYVILYAYAIMLGLVVCE